MQLNDIFKKEQYKEAYNFAEENDYLIQYLGLSEDNEELYQIIEKVVDLKAEQTAIIQAKINDLLAQLVATDYIALKIAEAETEEEKQTLCKKYVEQLNNRKFWREQINSLENQLKF